MISGLLILIPVIITGVALRLFFNMILVLVGPFLNVPISGLPTQAIAAIAVAMLLGLVYLLGAMTRRMFGRKLVSILEWVILHVPIVKSIYGASKQVLEALRSSNLRAFKAVVVIEYPQPGTYCIAFITSELTDPSGRPLISVFLPTTPNPTSGFVLILAADKVARTDLTIEEGIRMVISGGVLIPSTLPIPSGASAILPAS